VEHSKILSESGGGLGLHRERNPRRLLRAWKKGRGDSSTSDLLEK